MADDVTTPVPDGTAIATDEVAGAHVQRIKVLDGTDGSGEPLVVESNGALRRPMTVLKFAQLVDSITQSGGYTDGDVVGDPVDLGRYPQGIIPSMALTVVSAGGIALPALDVLIVQTPDAVTPGDVGADGDTYVPNALVATKTLGAAAAEFTPLAIAPLFLTWHTEVPRQLDNSVDNDPARWFLVLRAAETFTDDLTDGVVVDGWAEFAYHHVIAST